MEKRPQIGHIHSISISAERGQLKKEVFEANIIENFGIENDGHAGDWSRQITCLNLASVVKSNIENKLNMGPGDFAENILIEELNLAELKVGDLLSLGETALIEITQIGKEDHPSIVTKTFGVSLLPYEGLFCKALKSGLIKKGDIVAIVDLQI